MKNVKTGMGRRGVNFLEDGREWRLPGLLYADDFVLCGELVEDMRLMVGRFDEVCRRRGAKVSADKSKVIVLNGEEELECEVHLDGIRLEHFSEFKYLGYILGESGTHGAECSRKVASGKRVAGAIRSLVNTRDLQLLGARVLLETLLVLFLMYGSGTMLWKEE